MAVGQETQQRQMRAIKLALGLLLMGIFVEVFYGSATLKQAYDLVFFVIQGKVGEGIDVVIINEKELIITARCLYVWIIAQVHFVVELAHGGKVGVGRNEVEPYVFKRVHSPGYGFSNIVAMFAAGIEEEDGSGLPRLYVEGIEYCGAVHQPDIECRHFRRLHIGQAVFNYAPVFTPALGIGPQATDNKKYE